MININDLLGPLISLSCFITAIKLYCLLKFYEHHLQQEENPPRSTQES